MKHIKNFFSKLLLPTNISKIIVIFTVGLLSRYLINEYLDVNVFTEYLSLISIAFYSVFATFVVFVNELFSFFNINIIPNFIINILNSTGVALEYLVVKPFIYIYSITAGKYYGVHHIRSRSTEHAADYNNNRSNYSEDDRYKVNYNNMRNSSIYYPSNTQVSDFSNVNMSSYPSPHQVNYSNWETSPVSVRDNNSFYSRMAKENPFISDTNSVDSTASFTNNSKWHKGSYTEANYNKPGVNKTPSPKYFTVDSITENGIQRNVITPSSDNNNYQSQSNSLRPLLPKPKEPPMGNFNTHGVTRYPLTDANVYAHASRDSYASTVFTNDSNHATIYENSRSKSPYSTELDQHLKKIREAMIKRWEDKERKTLYFNEIANPPLQHRTFDVLNSPTRGNATVNIQYYNPKNVKSVFIHYHDVFKRKFFWNIWEKNHGEYNSYEEFKKNFNPNTKIWKEICQQIKSDISEDVRSLLNGRDLFGGESNKISTRDIRRIHNSSTTSRLNHINANRHISSGTKKTHRR